MFHCGTTMFIFLQVAVFLSWQAIHMADCLVMGILTETALPLSHTGMAAASSDAASTFTLPDGGGDGEKTRITQRWIDSTQWPIRDEIHQGLRNNHEGEHEITRPTGDPLKGNEARFSTKKKVSWIRKRTTVYFRSALEPCDYLALTCLRAYQTGRVCGRSTYATYYTFKNFCMLDYTNCMSRYHLWQAIHMGDCLVMGILTETALSMPEESSGLMQGTYIAEPDF